MRSYFSWEEQEANKQGHQDESRHRSDYEHDRYAYDGVDRAYWDGRKDEQEAERQREYERQEEQERERQERDRYDRQERQRKEERQYQEQLDYEREMEDRRVREEEYPNEISITEQELFMKIQEDERINSSDEQNNSNN